MKLMRGMWTFAVVSGLLSACTSAASDGATNDAAAGSRADGAAADALGVTPDDDGSGGAAGANVADGAASPDGIDASTGDAAPFVADAAARTDAPANVDAAVTADAGVRADAGVTPDAGVTADAQAAVDAGSASEASVKADAGASASDAAGACNALTLAGAPVPEVRASGTLPTAAGGAIADGTYVLSQWAIYPPGSIDAYMRSETWVVSGNTIQAVSKRDSEAEVHSSGTYLIDGATLVVAVTCPGVATATVSFSTTANGFQIIQNDSDKEVHSYTKL